MVHVLVRFQAFLLEQLAYQDAKYPRGPSELMDWQPDDTQSPPWTCPPWTCPAAPQESSETLLLELHRRNQQIRELREELEQEASPTSSPPPTPSSPACFSVQMKISELETRTRTT